MMKTKVFVDTWGGPEGSQSGLDQMQEFLNQDGIVYHGHSEDTLRPAGWIFGIHIFGIFVGRGSHRDRPIKQYSLVYEDTNEIIKEDIIDVEEKVVEI